MIVDIYSTLDRSCLECCVQFWAHSREKKDVGSCAKKKKMLNLDQVQQRASRVGRGQEHLSRKAEGLSLVLSLGERKASG